MRRIELDHHAAGHRLWMRQCLDEAVHGIHRNAEGVGEVKNSYAARRHGTHPALVAYITRADPSPAP
jgi:hypothetical protein